MGETALCLGGSYTHWALHPVLGGRPPVTAQSGQGCMEKLGDSGSREGVPSPAWGPGRVPRIIFEP